MFLRLGSYSALFFVMIYEQNIKEVKSLIFLVTT
jgi:hypothetical protein